MGTMILWMVKGKAVPVHAMKALGIVLQRHSFLEVQCKEVKNTTTSLSVNKLIDFF